MLLQLMYILFIASKVTNSLHNTCTLPTFYNAEIFDFTGTLLSIPNLPTGACVFNPSLVRVSKYHYIAFARVYVPRNDTLKCRGKPNRPPFLDGVWGWEGQQSSLLAVLHVSRDDSGFILKVVGYNHLDKLNLEDGRLFYDGSGRVRLYNAIQIGQAPNRATINTVHYVGVHCHRRCTVQLGPPRPLIYLKASLMDKNWVPWNGSSFMSYSYYGSLGPHAVFHWSSYQDPSILSEFNVVAHHQFFDDITKYFGKLVSLSGGTPAVLEKGGGSYIAVGHSRVHPSCLHPELHPSKKLSKNLCADLLKSDGFLKIPDADFIIKGVPHFRSDYGMFLYRFLSVPPFNITHISCTFMPVESDRSNHFGIVFPLGLTDTIDGQYLISYGDQDRATRGLLLSPKVLIDLLQPLSNYSPSNYKVCDLPVTFITSQLQQ